MTLHAANLLCSRKTASAPPGLALSQYSTGTQSQHHRLMFKAKIGFLGHLSERPCLPKAPPRCSHCGLQTPARSITTARLRNRKEPVTAVRPTPAEGSGQSCCSDHFTEGTISAPGRGALGPAL